MKKTSARKGERTLAKGEHAELFRLLARAGVNPSGLDFVRSRALSARGRLADFKALRPGTILLAWSAPVSKTAVKAAGMIHLARTRERKGLLLYLLAVCPLWRRWTVDKGMLELMNRVAKAVANPPGWRG